MSVTGTVARTAVVLAVTGGPMALKVRTLRQAIPVVVLGLVLSIALFGLREERGRKEGHFPICANLMRELEVVFVCIGVVRRVGGRCFSNAGCTDPAIVAG